MGKLADRRFDRIKADFLRNFDALLVLGVAPRDILIDLAPAYSRIYPLSVGQKLALVQDLTERGVDGGLAMKAASHWFRPLSVDSPGED